MPSRISTPKWFIQRLPRSAGSASPAEVLHDVGRGDGKLLLVERPGTHGPDVLEAQDADRLTVLPQGHIQHGADAERGQVVAAELAGP